MSYCMTKPTFFSKWGGKKIYKHTKKSFVFFFSPHQISRRFPQLLLGEDGGARAAPVTVSDSEMFKTVQGHHFFFLCRAADIRISPYRTLSSTTWPQLNSQWKKNKKESEKNKRMELGVLPKKCHKKNSILKIMKDPKEIELALKKKKKKTKLVWKQNSFQTHPFPPGVLLLSPSASSLSSSLSVTRTGKGSGAIKLGHVSLPLSSVGGRMGSSVGLSSSVFWV